MSAPGNTLSYSPAALSDPLVPPTPVSDEIDAPQTLAALVRIIRDCGMEPVTQLAGYLITDDPTYLPDTDHARLLANRIGRDKLLETLIELYLRGADDAESCS